MNKFKSTGPLAGTLLSLILLFSVCGPARVIAQIEEQQTEAAHKISESIASLVTEFDVNGMKVIVKRREGSLTVGATLFIKGGSRNITEKDAGIEALMLDASTEASLHYPKSRLRDNQSRMGTGISYDVSRDFSSLVLVSTRNYFEPSWDMFADVALHPKFDPNDFKLVKDRMLIGLKDDQDDPDSYLQQLQEKVAYAGHPYLNPPEGTAQSVASLTVADVVQHHKALMETSRLLLVVVGDLKPNDIRDKVKRTFGRLPRGTYTNKAFPALSFPASTVDITQRTLPTNYIQGIFAAPPLDSNDIYPMRVASSLLRDRLFEEVRTKRNLSYAPNAFLGSQGANVGGIYVTAVDANQTVGIMLKEIERLQTEPITQDEIIGIVAQYLTTYYIGQETNSAQAKELGTFELLGGGWKNSAFFLERLRKVTPEDVQRVAKTYMKHLKFVVIGDPTKVDQKVFTGLTTPVSLNRPWNRLVGQLTRRESSELQSTR